MANHCRTCTGVPAITIIADRFLSGDNRLGYGKDEFPPNERACVIIQDSGFDHHGNGVTTDTIYHGVTWSEIFQICGGIRPHMARPIPTNTSIREGDRVDVQYMRGRWKIGRVQSVEPEEYFRIKFDDDPNHWLFSRRNIRTLNEVEENHRRRRREPEPQELRQEFYERVVRRSDYSSFDVQPPDRTPVVQLREYIQERINIRPSKHSKENLEKFESPTKEFPKTPPRPKGKFLGRMVAKDESDV